MIDTIPHKYITGLQAINRMRTPSLDAVELALRLALAELNEQIARQRPEPAPTYPHALAALQQRIEQLQNERDHAIAERDAAEAQLGRLDEWLAEHSIGGDSDDVERAIREIKAQRQQIVILDADNASLICRRNQYIYELEATQ